MKILYRYFDNKDALKSFLEKAWEDTSLLPSLNTFIKILNEGPTIAYEFYIEKDDNNQTHIIFRTLYKNGNASLLEVIDTDKVLITLAHPTKHRNMYFKPYSDSFLGS